MRRRRSRALRRHAPPLSRRPQVRLGCAGDGQGKHGVHEYYLTCVRGLRCSIITLAAARRCAIRLHRRGMQCVHHNACNNAGHRGPFALPTHCLPRLRWSAPASAPPASPTARPPPEVHSKNNKQIKRMPAQATAGHQPHHTLTACGCENRNTQVPRMTGRRASPQTWAVSRPPFHSPSPAFPRYLAKAAALRVVHDSPHKEQAPGAPLAGIPAVTHISTSQRALLCHPSPFPE